MRTSTAEHTTTADGYRPVKASVRSSSMLAILAQSQLSKVAVCTSPPIISRVQTKSSEDSRLFSQELLTSARFIKSLSAWSIP